MKRLITIAVTTVVLISAGATPVSAVSYSKATRSDTVKIKIVNGV